MFKRISVILLLILVVSIPTFANTEAEALNEFEILKGDGVSYNLDGQLKRSEAVTFIIRLLGKEERVLANSATLSRISFPDVKADDWFAPYVGYAKHNNIVEGFPSGEFKPNDYVSEKAFLKMLITTLGYEYEEDYSWDNLYQMAYNLEIIETIKNVDNLNYKREAVVDSIYNALSTKLKSSDERLIDQLIDSEIIEENTAMKYDFIEDELISEIESVEVNSKKDIVVTINEEISSIDSIEILNETDNEELAVDEYEIDGKTMTISTNSQKAMANYTLMITGVKDKQGFSVDLSDTFVGYEDKEITSDYFKVSKVNVISNREVHVYFTTPISMSISNPFLYEITRDDKSFVENSFDDMRLTTLAENDQVLVIYLKNDTLTPGHDYELKLSGDITNVYGAPLESGEGKDIRIYGMSNSPNSIQLTGVRTIDNKTLQAMFNREVDLSSGNNISNYTISPLTGIVKVTLAEDRKSAYIGLSTALDNGDFYTLTVDNVKDHTQGSEIDEQEAEFVGTDNERDDVSIDFVFTHDSKHISVYFSDKLDEGTANQKNNFVISSTDDTSFTTSNPEEVLHKSADGKRVDLFLKDESLQKDFTYSVQASSSLKSYVRGDVSTTPFEFETINLNDMNMSFTNALVIADDIVRLKASKHIQKSGVNELNSNCTLYYKDNDGDKKYIDVDNVRVYNNEYLMIRSKSDFDIGRKYYADFNQIVDYGGNVYTNILRSFEK